MLKHLWLTIYDRGKIKIATLNRAFLQNTRRLMMMKTTKLMIATTLATALIVVITESVDAQNSGSSYSRKNNLPELEFDLLFRRAGEIFDISDDDKNADSGSFSGAINNFRYKNDQTADNPFLRPPEKYWSFSFLLDMGDLITRLDGNTAKYTIFSGNEFQFEGNFSKKNDEGEDESGDPFSKTINQGLPIYTFELNIGDLSEEDRRKAVNDLLFIVESNLYNPSRLKNESFVQETLGFDLAIPDLRPFDEGGSGYECTKISDNSDNTDCTNAGIPVPETNTSLASLLLGALGIGLVLKRNIKTKQT